MFERPPNCPDTIWASLTDPQKQAVIFHEELHKYVGFLHDFITVCERYRECNEIPDWLQGMYDRAHELWIYPGR